MNKKIFFIAGLLASVFQSCKNDFEVNAPYTENAVIYGILNPDTTTQIIRINKSFLGSGNAKAYAKIPDSINYGKELKVWLIQSTGSANDSILLQDTIIDVSSNGDFATKQKIYITRNKIVAGSNYSLYALNTKTGKKYTATSPTVGNIKLRTISTLTFYSDEGSPKPYATSFQGASNAIKYFVLVRFNYVEVVGGARYPKAYDYITTVDGLGVADGASLSTDVIAGDQYYSSLRNYVQSAAAPGYVPGVSKRYIDVNGNMDVFVTGYTQELNNYLEVNKPSTGVNQDKNTYSNINNGTGLGIFASKDVKFVKGKRLSDASLNQLTNLNAYTKDLDFDASKPNP